jgi:hypothetical protein
MAVLTIYPLGTAATAPDWFGNMQVGGTAPTAANSAFGFQPAKTALTTPYYRGRIGATAQATVAQAASYNAAASSPVAGTGTGATTAGDSFSVGPLNGTFPAGNWTFNWFMRASTAGAIGRINMRVWRGTNDTGAGATQVLANTNGATVTLSTTADVNSTITAAMPQMVLVNEYLFFQVEWQETTVGSTNGCNALFRIGTSTITTTNFNANIQFVANNLAIVALAIDVEILVQKHVLGTSAPTVAGSPVFGDLVFGEISPIDNIPAGITAAAGSPTLDAPAISEIPNFVPPAFAVTALALGVGTFGQQHSLSTPLTATAGLPFIATAALTQSNILTPINATAGVPSFTAATMNVRLSVDALGFATAAPVFGKPTMISGLQEVLFDAYVIDNGLASLSTADQMLLCTTQPVNYANAIATRLATKTLGAGNVFGPPTIAADGRKCTSAPISDGVVDVNGDAVCWVAVNAGGSQLLVSGLIDLTAVATNASWAMTPVAVHLPSGA